MRPGRSQRRFVRRHGDISATRLKSESHASTAFMMTMTYLTAASARFTGRSTPASPSGSTTRQYGSTATTTLAMSLALYRPFLRSQRAFQPCWGWCYCCPPPQPPSAVVVSAEGGVKHVFTEIAATQLGQVRHVLAEITA